MFYSDVSVLKIGEEWLEMASTSEEDFEIHLPEIMKAVFELWEDKKMQEEDTSEKIANARRWNGVIA